MKKRRKAAPAQPATDWERLLKSKVIAFEVERLTPGLRAARWIASRDPKARGAYAYQLPKK